VLFERSVVMGDETSYMGGHPLAFLEGLQRAGGKSDIEFFPNEPIRNAVVMFFHLDVVVDVDRGYFPLGIFVGSFGQRFGLGAIEQLEEFLARLHSAYS